jgi:hypothetical protein
MALTTRRRSPLSLRTARLVRALIIVSWTVALALLVGAGGSAGASEPAAQVLPSAVPSPTPDQPLTDSVDRIVKKVEEEREAACAKAREAGVPCFPVAIEKSARATLEEALNRVRQDKRPYKGNPGQSPLDLNRPRERQLPVGGVGFDPVCAVRLLAKAIKGRNQTYYVYRVRDRGGEHIEMRDRPLDPKAYAQVAPFESELIGQYTGECEALAAHNKAQRELSEKERQQRLQRELQRAAQQAQQAPEADPEADKGTEATTR